MPDPDLYPLRLLAGYTLMPTGVASGVMAVCNRHGDEVPALVVGDCSASPALSDLAFLVGEHEAVHHDGPAMPDPDTWTPMWYPTEPAIPGHAPGCRCGGCEYRRTLPHSRTPA